MCPRTGGRRDRPGSHATRGDRRYDDSQELIGEPTQIMRRYLSHFGDETDNLVGHLTAALEIWEKDYDIKSANQTNEYTFDPVTMALRPLRCTILIILLFN